MHAHLPNGVIKVDFFLFPYFVGGGGTTKALSLHLFCITCLASAFTLAFIVIRTQDMTVNDLFLPSLVYYLYNMLDE